MGPGLFWNFPPKAGCTVPQSLLQTMYVGSWSHRLYHTVPHRSSRACVDLSMASPSIRPILSISQSSVSHSFCSGGGQKPPDPVTIHHMQREQSSICHLTNIYLEIFFFNHNILEQILGFRLGVKPDPETEKSPNNIWCQPIPGDTLCHWVSSSRSGLLMVFINQNPNTTHNHFFTAALSDLSSSLTSNSLPIQFFEFGYS